MKKMVLAIFVCLLFVASGFATATSDVGIVKEANNTESDGRILVIGIMEKMDNTETTIDYEVLSFAWFFEGGLQKLNEGEMVRLHSPAIIIDIFNLVIGFCDDWSIIG